MTCTSSSGEASYDAPPPLPNDDRIGKIGFKNMLDRSQAEEILRQWWCDGPKARNLEKDGRVISCDIQYVPFRSMKWGATTYMDVSLVSTFDNSPVKIVNEMELVRTEVACNANDFEVEFLPVLGGETVPDSMWGAPEPEVTISEDEVLARQKTIVKNTFSAMLDKEHQYLKKQIHTRLIESRLVYYPLWVLRYSYRDQSYQATIDGVTGEVLSGRAPGDLLTRFRDGACVLLACILCAALSVWIMENIGWIGILFFGSIIFLFCLGLVWWKFPFLRYGSVIVTGQAEGEYRYNSS